MYDGRKEKVSSTLWKVRQAFRKIEKSNDNDLKKMLHTLENSDKMHIIKEGNENNVSNNVVLEGREINAGKSEKDGDRLHTVTNFDFSNEAKENFKKIEGVPASDLSIVAHEMRHVFDDDQGKSKDNNSNNSASDPSEIRAVETENKARKIENLPKRKTYGGEKIQF